MSIKDLTERELAPLEYDTCCAIGRCGPDHPGARRHVDGGYYFIAFEGEPRYVKAAIAALAAVANGEGKP